MADTIEKVYCTGDGGNDNLAAALLARGRDNDPATMLAAMNGGMGGGWNNPFAYMMMLGMFRFMYGDGWNGQNGNVQRAEIQSQIDSLRNQMSDNHNSDLLMGAIQGNNQLGQKNIENSMQRGFDFNNRSIERGFSALGFQLQQDKCDIIRSNQDNTQRVIDVLNNHWQQDLQQRYNDARLELSQQRQNAELIAALKTTTTTTGA